MAKINSILSIAEQADPNLPALRARVPVDLLARAEQAFITDRELDDFMHKVSDRTDLTFGEWCRLFQPPLMSCEEAGRLSAQKIWLEMVETFMCQTLASEGIDYKGNKLLGAALDVAVKTLAADPLNAEKDGEWFLEEAHKQVRALFGPPKTKRETKAYFPGSTRLSRAPDRAVSVVCA